MCYNNKTEDFLDRLQKVIDDAGKIMILVEDLEKAFPELEEKNNEKIRKALIEMLDNGGDLWIDYDVCKDEAIDWLEKQKPISVKPHLPDGSSIYDKTFEEAQKYLSDRNFDIPWNDSDVFVDERYITQTVANVLAWGDEHPNQKIVSQLKKQSEKKSTDTITPKFKVGDWVILDNNHNSLYQIEKIENYQYFLRHFLGGAMPLNFCNENDIKLWTIKDAKDGDVLCAYEGDEPKIVFILKGTYKGYAIKYHCFYNIKYPKFDDASEPGNLGFYDEEKKDFRPATKEQRNLLFRKMKEAGYDLNKEEE